LSIAVGQDSFDDAVQREPERGSWRDLCPHTAGGGRYQGGGGRAGRRRSGRAAGSDARKTLGAESYFGGCGNILPLLAAATAASRASAPPGGALAGCCRWAAARAVDPPMIGGCQRHTCAAALRSPPPLWRCLSVHVSVCRPCCLPPASRLADVFAGARDRPQMFARQCTSGLAAADVVSSLLLCPSPPNPTLLRVIRHPGDVLTDALRCVTAGEETAAAVPRHSRTPCQVPRCGVWPASTSAGHGEGWCQMHCSLRCARGRHPSRACAR
jgi:hypothetical protein